MQRFGICSECGGPMNVGRDSAPPERRRCRDCQRACPKRAERATSSWEPQLVTCRCGEVFEQRRPGQKYCRKDHRHNTRPGRIQPSAAARGYGYRHQQQRTAALAALVPGAPCPRCGDEMHPDQDLHLDHADHDRNVYLGLSHAHCNLSAGAARGNRLRRPWWERQRKQLALFAPPKPPRPKPMRQCACGRQFYRRGGRGNDCPDCVAGRAKRALAMRNAGVGWKEIAAAIGYSGPGAAYNLVMTWRHVA